jgi:hypothetical protein
MANQTKRKTFFNNLLEIPPMMSLLNLSRLIAEEDDARRGILSSA